jgi:molecular chaperone DnaK (HSP70)
MIAGAPTRLVRVGGAALPWWALALASTLALAACKKGTPPPSLGEPVSIEQPGGAATQLIERGSEIPTSATESFTTVRDGERHIAVHLLRGAGKSAQKLRDEGWWVVDGVSVGRAGQPRVLVTFEVDSQGALSVTAREGDRKLRVAKVDNADRTVLAPAPLSEPDEEEDAADDDK